MVLITYYVVRSRWRVGESSLLRLSGNGDEHAVMLFHSMSLSFVSYHKPVRNHVAPDSPSDIASVPSPGSVLPSSDPCTGKIGHLNLIRLVLLALLLSITVARILPGERITL